MKDHVEPPLSATQNDKTGDDLYRALIKHLTVRPRDIADIRAGEDKSQTNIFVRFTENGRSPHKGSTLVDITTLLNDSMPEETAALDSLDEQQRLERKRQFIDILVSNFQEHLSHLPPFLRPGAPPTTRKERPAPTPEEKTATDKKAPERGFGIEKLMAALKGRRNPAARPRTEPAFPSETDGINGDEILTAQPNPKQPTEEPAPLILGPAARIMDGLGAENDTDPGAQVIMTALKRAAAGNGGEEPATPAPEARDPRKAGIERLEKALAAAEQAAPPSDDAEVAQPGDAHHTGKETASPAPKNKEQARRKSLTKIADEIFWHTLRENGTGIDLHDIEKAYHDGKGNLLLSVYGNKNEPIIVSADALAKLGTAQVIATDLNALKELRKEIRSKHPLSPDFVAVQQHDPRKAGIERLEKALAAAEQAAPQPPQTALATAKDSEEAAPAPAPVSMAAATQTAAAAQDAASAPVQAPAIETPANQNTRMTAGSRYAQGIAKAVFAAEAPGVNLQDVAGITLMGENRIALQLNDGQIRNVNIDPQEANFASAHEFTRALTLAKHTDNQADVETVLAKLKAMPALENVETASAEKGRLKLAFRNETAERYAVKTRLQDTRFATVEEFAQSINTAIQNKEWLDAETRAARLEAQAA